MNIAFLYLFTGIGHYREAYAIAKVFEENGHQVNYIDIREVIKNDNRWFSRLLVKFYDSGLAFAFKFMNKPDVYLNPQKNSKLNIWIYKNLLGLASHIENFAGSKLKMLFNFEQYDAVISIHPLTSGLAKGAINPKILKKKLFNVIPDEITQFGAYFYKIDGVINFVNSEQVREELVRIGLKNELIITAGHPLDTLLLNNREQIHSRIINDLQADVLNVGLYLGGFAPRSQQERIIQTIVSLKDHIINGDLKIKTISWNHPEFEKKLDLALQQYNLEDKVEKIYIDSPYELVYKGHNWMLTDIDVMFSRPSELTFYSLALGIPHILFPAVGPQELDMYNMLRNYADVQWWQSIKNNIYEYLTNKTKLIQTANKLYNSNYNMHGAQFVYDYITKTK